MNRRSRFDDNAILRHFTRVDWALLGLVACLILILAAANFAAIHAQNTADNMSVGEIDAAPISNQLAVDDDASLSPVGDR